MYLVFLHREMEQMKTPEELAKEWAIDWHKDCDYPEAILKQTHAATMTTFLAGYKAGREMSNKEIFDLYLELRKKHGQEEPKAKPAMEKFKFTYIEKKGFF